jgi:two-component system, sensor histidine kinase and response regulator
MLLAVVGVLGLYTAQVGVERLNVAVGHHFREVSLVGDITSDVGLIRSAALLHALSNSNAERDRYEIEIAELEQQADDRVDELLRTETSFGDTEDVERVEAFRLAWNGFVDVRDKEFLPLSRDNRDEEALTLAQRGGSFDQTYRQAKAQLRGLQSILETDSADQLAYAQDDFSRNRNALFATVVLAGLFGIVFGLRQSARLAAAVRALSRAAARVADGDFGQRLQVRTGDEIESLANSFNTMTANLQLMTETLSQQLQQLEQANRALEIEVVDRRRAEAALRQSDERFRSVTQSVNEGIISTDSRGNIVFWNRGAQSIFGYSEHEILGQPLDLLLAERSKIVLRAMLDCARLTGSTEAFAEPHDWYGLRKDRSEFPLDISLATWTKGEAAFFSGVFRDETERRAVDRMKNEFIAMVSHELRTPMNGVIGLTDLLLRTDLAPEQREYADGLHRSSNLLLGLINDILDLSKIEAGKLDLDLTDLDVRQVAEEVAVLVAEQARGKGLEIICAVEPNVPSALRGDPDRLRQILLNLVSNGVKFTTSGEVVVRAWATEETEDSVLLRFEVQDTGIGIAPEAQHLLFKPFQQVDGSTRRNFGGTGLGLSISRRLVELMGGELGVESSAGRGSTFWFAVRFDKQPATSAPRPAAAASLAGMRVLVVDRSQHARAALQQQLEAWQMVAEPLEDLNEVLPRLRTAASRAVPQRIVILGAEEGSGDALELAWAIRTDADPAVAATRVILLSWTDREPHGSDLRAKGVVWLRKPVLQKRLLVALHRALSGSTPDPSPAASTWAEAERSPRSIARAPQPGGPLVLVAEDSAINRQVVTNMLRSLGYAADVVVDGTAAVEALSRRSYAAVLMDSHMPGLDGFEVTAQVRCGESRGRWTPIIAITASAMQGDRERCLAAGMNDYLAKPIRLDELAGVLARWIPSTDSSEPIDRSALEGLCAYQEPGEPDLIGTTLQLYKTEAPQLFATIRDAVDREDPELLWRAAHTLKGASGTIGAREVEAICTAVERLGRRGTTVGAGELCHVLEAAVERATAALAWPLAQGAA